MSDQTTKVSTLQHFLKVMYSTSQALHLLLLPTVLGAGHDDDDEDDTQVCIEAAIFPTNPCW